MNEKGTRSAATAIYLSPAGWGERDIPSLEEQERLCAAYVREHDLRLTRIYRDERPGMEDGADDAWLHLLTDVERGVVQTIVVYAAECVGRTVFGVMRELRDFLLPCGIRFVDVLYGFDSLNGDLNRYVKEKNHEFSSFRTNRYHKQSREEKSINMRAVPYGYRYVKDGNPCIVIDEETALFVKEIFRLAEAGEPLRGILAWLQAQGAPSPAYRKYELYGHKDKTGNQWAEKQIRNILQNEIYTGDFVGMKVHEHHEAGGRTTVRMPEEAWLVIRNHHEPLISKETFQAVQPHKRKLDPDRCEYNGPKKHRRAV